MNIKNLRSIIIKNCENAFNEIKYYVNKKDYKFETIQLKFRAIVFHQLTYDISAEYSYVQVYDLFLEIYYGNYFDKLLSYCDEGLK